MKRPAFAPVRNPTVKAIPKRTAPGPSKSLKRRRPQPDQEPGWNAGEVVALREGIAAGLSYGQIRKQRLPHRSRNAIISKCHRLGIRERMNDVERRARTSQHISARHFAQRVRKGEINQSPLAEVIHLRVVPIEKLTDASCRWPLGEPKSAHFGFCGCDKVSGESYCETHLKIAYEPAPKVDRPKRLERLTDLDLAA